MFSFCVSINYTEKYESNITYLNHVESSHNFSFNGGKFLETSGIVSCLSTILVLVERGYHSSFFVFGYTLRNQFYTWRTDVLIYKFSQPNKYNVAQMSFLPNTFTSFPEYNLLYSIVDVYQNSILSSWMWT